jgi:hypothetical protein
MAIPSYAGDDITAYENGEYLEYVANLVGIVANSYSEVRAALIELREWIISYGKVTSVINTDGSIDLSKVTSPTLAMLKSADLKIYGTPGIDPAYMGYENGVRFIIFGEDAVPFIQAASMPREQYLIPPTLLGLGSVGIKTSVNSDEMKTISFGASFMTFYGESQMSNLIPVGPMAYWDSVTLGVVTSDIPSYATSVIYYREFDGVLRRVMEVKL